MKPLRLSHTAWDTYNTCGYRYYLRYVLRIKPFIPVRYPLVTGIAFHSLVEDMYREEKFDKKFLIYNWKDKFNAALDNEAKFFSSTKGSEKQLKYGYGMIHKFYNYAKDNGYLIKPIAIEWGYKIPFGASFLVGKTDLVIKRNKVPYIEILDFKTSRKLPTKSEVKKNLQLSLYDWAVKKKLIGNKKTKVGLFFARHGAIMHSTRSNKDHIDALKKFNNLHKNIKNRKFDPNNKSCKWCEFNKTKYCDFWQKK